MTGNRVNKLIILDLETTGSNPINDEIIEIGAVKVVDGEIVDTFNELICPSVIISEYISELTGITNEMVKNKPKIENVLPRFIEFCEDFVIMGHNVILFDYRMLKVASNKLGYRFEKFAIDTLVISRKCLPDLPSRRLGDLCNYYGIELKKAHRALFDAKATYYLYTHLLNDFSNKFPEIFIPRKIAWKIPKSSNATEKQKSFLRQLILNHNIKFDKEINSLTKSQASRSIDNIIKIYGRGE